MEVEWIDVTDRLPIDLWKEQFPSSNNYKNILGYYLAVFEDKDKNGKVWDQSVVPVSYSGKHGWMYFAEHIPHPGKEDIIKWMPFPTP